MSISNTDYAIQAENGTSWLVELSLNPVFLFTNCWGKKGWRRNMQPAFHQLWNLTGRSLLFEPNDQRKLFQLVLELLVLCRRI